MRKPEHKGEVERPFQYIEGNFLAGRKFDSLADVNHQAHQWIEEVANQRKHGTTKERPAERFEAEREALIPLPQMPFDTAEVGYRVASLDAFVDWEGTRYSVPLDDALQLVVVRATSDRIFIYRSDLTLSGEHPRSGPGQKQLVVSEAHRPRGRRIDPEMLAQRFEAWGEEASAFARGVLARQRYRGRHLAMVLDLTRAYALDDLIAALERAVRYSAFDAQVVRRILEAEAVPRALPATSSKAAEERLQQAGRQASVEPRPLEDYERAVRPESHDHDHADRPHDDDPEVPRGSLPPRRTGGRNAASIAASKSPNSPTIPLSRRSTSTSRRGWTETS